MSPEQADGRPIDRRSDIFSLGVLFHECLTGQRLFRGYDDLHTLRLVREADIAPPSSMRGEVPRALDRIVRKMLARDPNDRYARCADVVRDLAPIILEHHAGTETLSLYVQGFAGHQVFTGESAIISTTSTERPRTAHLERELRPAKMRRVALLVGAMLGLVAAGVVYWMRRAPTAPARTVSERSAIADAGAAAALPQALAPDAALAQAEGPKVTPPPPVPPAEERTVALSVSGTRGAKVSVDGREVGRVPLELRLPVSTETHVVLVEMKGRVSRSFVVSGEHGSKIAADLRGPQNKPNLPAGIKDPFGR
jgi:hypothetical protein